MNEPMRKTLRDMVKLLRAFEDAEAVLDEAERTRAATGDVKRDLEALSEKRERLRERIEVSRAACEEAALAAEAAKVEGDTRIEAERRRAASEVDAAKRAAGEQLGVVAIELAAAEEAALERRTVAEERALAAEERAVAAEQRLAEMRAMLAG